MEKSLQEKEGYVALAHTRLGNRAYRPGMELCKDSVEIALVNEVAELRRNCANIQHMLAEVNMLLFQFYDNFSNFENCCFETKNGCSKLQNPWSKDYVL